MQKLNRVGETFYTNTGDGFEIIKYPDRKSCTIRFYDGIAVENIQFSNIKKGQVIHPNYKSLYGIGYTGVGKYKKEIKNSMYWKNIFQRAYSKEYHEKYPTYIDCIIADDWHNFQNFAEWFENNYNSKIMKSWCLDKDLLIKGNKIYSAETCCFIPNEINVLFTKRQNHRGKYPIGVSRTKSGKFLTILSKNSIPIRVGLFNTPELAFEAYKIAKEAYIKEKADEWKPFIDSRVYKAMYNYKIEITD
jgi:hypothetical protein